jgi:hypothetical protein
MVGAVGPHRIIVIESIGVYPNIYYREVIEEARPLRRLSPTEEEDIFELKPMKVCRSEGDYLECRGCSDMFLREQAGDCGTGRKEYCPKCCSIWVDGCD